MVAVLRNRHWCSDVWYVSNVSIIFDCSMLIYDQSWMFYNDLLSTLYHFLVLTYWHSAKCQLLFSALFDLQKIHIKRSPNAAKLFVDFFGARRQPWVRRTTRDEARGGQHLPGRAIWAWHGQGVLAPSMPRSTTSLLYKYSKIPETLGESTKNNSSCRKFHNNQIQSRHHHGGVHHVHWCLSDDAWVVHCRPSGL